MSSVQMEFNYEMVKLQVLSSYGDPIILSQHFVYFLLFTAALKPYQVPLPDLSPVSILMLQQNADSAEKTLLNEASLLHQLPICEFN